MPLTLPPITRRRFLRGALAASAAAALPRSIFGAPAPGTSGGAGVDPDSFALLADTHIPANATIKSGTTNMTENMLNVTRQLTALAKTATGSSGKRPAHVLIDGDCAHIKGLPEDYSALSELLKPLREAGYPVHMTMGNHDARAAFYEKVLEQTPDNPPVEDKYVTVIQSPRANWFLIDSLHQTNFTGGQLGDKQIDWLTAALDKHADKPAIVVGHHNPQWDVKPNDKWFGIKDANTLFERLTPRKHVKAYIFGHTHDWRLEVREGIHLINLPPVAYVFKQGRPNGWTHAQLTDDSIALTLQCHDESHADHGKTVTLKWRAG